MPEARFIPPGAERDVILLQYIMGGESCKHYRLDDEIKPISCLEIALFDLIGSAQRYCVVVSEMPGMFNHITNNVPNTWDRIQSCSRTVITIGSTGEKFRVPYVWKKYKLHAPFTSPGTIVVVRDGYLDMRVLVPGKIVDGDWICNPFTNEMIQVSSGAGDFEAYIYSKTEVYHEMSQNELSLFKLSPDQVAPFLVIDESV